MYIQTTKQQLNKRKVNNMKTYTNIKRKAHNFILKVITAIATILFVISAMALDSASIFPAVVCIICLLWLVVVSWATEYNQKKSYK